MFQNYNIKLNGFIIYLKYVYPNWMLMTKNSRVSHRLQLFILNSYLQNDETWKMHEKQNNLLINFTFQIVITNRDACVIYDSLCQFSFSCKYKQNLVIFLFQVIILYTCMRLIYHCRFRNWVCVQSLHQPFPLCPAVLPM